MNEEWFVSFREKLDQHHVWPTLYMFKFIVPAGSEQKVRDVFPKHTTTERPSKQGTYTSVTVQAMMPSAEAVIEIYKKAAQIEGLIAL